MNSLNLVNFGEMEENLRRQDAEVEKSIAIVKETLQKMDAQP